MPVSTADMEYASNIRTQPGAPRRPCDGDVWSVSGCFEPVVLLVLLWLTVPPFSLPGWGGFVDKAQVIRWLALAFALWKVKGDVRGYKPGWTDALVLVYCCMPLFAAVGNGLGYIKGLLELSKECIYWYVPFWLGKQAVMEAGSRFAAGLPAHQTLVRAVVWGAWLYLIPASIEIFAGPIFTELITGQALSGQTAGADRGWTYRPSVFLSSGFVLTMFYVLAVLLVAAKWLKTKPQAGNSRVNRSKVELARDWLESRTGLSVQLGLFAGIVLVSLSLGSIVLLSLGWLGLLGLHSSDRWLQRGVRGLLMVALPIPAAYMLVRTTGWLSTERLNTVTQRMVSQERAGSFDYRLRAEETVMAHMHDHWILGWGDWGRWQQGEPTLALDGFWLFALTRSGMLTVVVWFAMVAIPVLVRLSGRGPRCAVADGLAIFLLLSLIDSMFNYFGDVHQMLALGTLAAMVGGRRI